MTAISNAWVNALLADAAYVDVLDESLNSSDNIRRLGERMTPELATYIAANFEVASAINTPDWPALGSGFDATVWRGRAGTEFAGQVFVSTRGTEPPGIDIWGADVDLAVNVAARSQIIDMVNWWVRETAPAGVAVAQIKWDPLRTKPGTISEIEPGLVLADPTGMQATRLEALELVTERFVQAAGTAEYLALLSCDSPKALESNLCSEFLWEAQ